DRPHDCGRPPGGVACLGVRVRGVDDLDAADSKSPHAGDRALLAHPRDRTIELPSRPADRLVADAAAHAGAGRSTPVGAEPTYPTATRTAETMRRPPAAPSIYWRPRTLNAARRTADATSRPAMA